MRECDAYHIQNVLARLAEFERVYLSAEVLPRIGAEMIDKETFERMFDIVTGKVESVDDLKFVRNNIESFSKAMLKIATMELINVDGVSPDKVEAILQPLTHVFHMAGASSYADFSDVADMFREEGLA